MLYIVGLGPGSQQLMTQEAIETIKKKWIQLLATLLIFTWWKT